MQAVVLPYIWYPNWFRSHGAMTYSVRFRLCLPNLPHFRMFQESSALKTSSISLVCFNDSWTFEAE
jgi:hypothetical protein